MSISTVIFDMDGLLIDSEPLWKEAAAEIFRDYAIQLSASEYHSTMGMRTSEFVSHWFRRHEISPALETAAGDAIVKRVIELVRQKGKPMPGVNYILDFFGERNFNIGLATSSGQALIDVVVEELGIRDRFRAICSAADLDFGKPHPQVYLDCAARLGASPRECICFEDSFNGMIAAKAARMKCVVVPAAADIQSPHWHAADLKLSSLYNFNDLLLHSLSSY